MATINELSAALTAAQANLAAVAADAETKREAYQAAADLVNQANSELATAQTALVNEVMSPTS